MPVPPRTSFNSSRLVRSLAGLGIADVADPPQTFAERLSAWIGWTDAPVLSAALGADAGVPATALTAEARQAVIHEVQRVRGELAHAIECDVAFAATRPSRGRPGSVTATAAAAADADFNPGYGRRRHAVLQQLMEDRIRLLREQVRSALTAAAPALARLAALDAAFEQALAPRERPLLGAAAVLVEAHFERRREARPRTGAAPALRAADYRRAMRELLLAELDTRLQPVDGLIDALQQHTAGMQA